MLLYHLTGILTRFTFLGIAAFLIIRQLHFQFIDYYMKIIFIFVLGQISLHLYAHKKSFYKYIKSSLMRQFTSSSFGNVKSESEYKKRIKQNTQKQLKNLYQLRKYNELLYKKKLVQSYCKDNDNSIDFDKNVYLCSSSAKKSLDTVMEEFKINQQYIYCDEDNQNSLIQDKQQQEKPTSLIKQSKLIKQDGLISQRKLSNMIKQAEYEKNRSSSRLPSPKQPKQESKNIQQQQLKICQKHLTPQQKTRFKKPSFSDNFNE